MFDLYEKLPGCYLEGIQAGITARQWIKIYYIVVFILGPQALEVNSSNTLHHHLVKHLTHGGHGNCILKGGKKQQQQQQAMNTYSSATGLVLKV